MKKSILLLTFCFGILSYSFSQTSDTAKKKQDNTVHIYFIITAGEKINAYFHDKPLDLETSEEFNDYVQKNIKNLKDSWVVVTGKPKTGTFDAVMKTLKKYRFKNISTNITAN